MSVVILVPAVLLCLAVFAFYHATSHIHAQQTYAETCTLEIMMDKHATELAWVRAVNAGEETCGNGDYLERTANAIRVKHGLVVEVCQTEPHNAILTTVDLEVCRYIPTEGVR